VQFAFIHCGVILSAAVFQAERRISRSTGSARKPNCTTTKRSKSHTDCTGSANFANLRDATLGAPFSQPMRFKKLPAVLTVAERLNPSRARGGESSRQIARRQARR